MKGILFLNSSRNSLEPVTLSQYCSMIPAANSPICLLNLNVLLSAGISSIALCFNGDDECFKNFFEDGSKYNCNISYIKYTNIESLFKSIEFKNFLGDEAAVLIDGDDYYNININEYTDKFASSSSDALVLTENVESPWQTIVARVKYGILSGIEKEPRISSSRIGITGIYFFKQYIFKMLSKLKIPHQYVSAPDIVKFLLSKGLKVSAVQSNGFHMLINSFNNILSCNRYVLDKINQKNIQGEECLILNSTIDDGGTIGDRCIIKNSIIRNSIIMDNCLIEGVEIYDSIVCKNSTITGSGKVKGIFAEKTRLSVN